MKWNIWKKILAEVLTNEESINENNDDDINFSALELSLEEKKCFR